MQTRPLTPDTKVVGHIMAVPAKPLPADLERFVAGAGSKGVVIVSMGTNAQFGAPWPTCCCPSGCMLVVCWSYNFIILFCS